MKATVLLSGGMDSSTLAYLLVRSGYTVDAIGVHYGQRHARELTAAVAIAEHLQIPFDVIDLRAVGRFLTGSSQTDLTVAVPEGHYADESMKKTVVPNRNMMMLATAGAVAIARGSDVLAYACHAGDHTIYPDCRPAFVSAMNAALSLCDWRPLSLYTPFVHDTKTDIARLGIELGVPFQETWSCYKGGELHCGKCGTCVERREAFRDAMLTDPTRYEVL